MKGRFTGAGLWGPADEASRASAGPPVQGGAATGAVPSCSAGDMRSVMSRKAPQRLRGARAM
jgi:hypothetical protein